MFEKLESCFTFLAPCELTDYIVDFFTYGVPLIGIYFIFQYLRTLDND